MFHWEKTIQTLDIPASKVLQLHRSMRDVQLALPGLPPQEATAYLCQFATTHGVGTAAVFHLHKSGLIAFYVDEPQEVAADRAAAMLDQAQVFVESMGFLLTDLDIQLLGETDRELLWSTLPLQKGVTTPVVSASPKPAPPKASPRKFQETPAKPVARGELPAELQPLPTLQDDIAQSSPGNVDRLLAAVEELRTRRPGAPTRRQPPTPLELHHRRQELRENLGRVLASL